MKIKLNNIFIEVPYYSKKEYAVFFIRNSKILWAYKTGILKGELKNKKINSENIDTNTEVRI